MKRIDFRLDNLRYELIEAVATDLDMSVHQLSYQAVVDMLSFWTKSESELGQRMRDIVKRQRQLDSQRQR